MSLILNGNGWSDYRDPTTADLQRPEFNAIWDVIKTWTIIRKGAVMETTGNCVCAILDAVDKENAGEKDLLIKLKAIHVGEKKASEVPGLENYSIHYEVGGDIIGLLDLLRHAVKSNPSFKGLISTALK